jgi:hypothetical protein
MEKEASLVGYFEYEGLPVSVRKGNLPVMLNRRGEKVVLYDLEKFYREAHYVTQSKYLTMVRRVAR